MTSSEPPVDLGHGVTVRLEGDGLRVESLEIELAWHTGSGHLPGTAVVWQGEPLEVVERSESAVGHLFRLAPWPEGATMRTVVRLDTEAVIQLAAAARAAAASGHMRRTLTMLAPLAALAPEALQTRWHLEHGYPAVAATYLSAFIEIGMGTLGVLQLFASVGGGGSLLLAPWLHWLGPVGPFVLAEGLVRLVLAMSRHAPVGSLLGLPLLLLEGRRPKPPPDRQPRLLALDDGILELLSPELRRDWDGGDGVLAYRGRWFRLEAAARAPGGWQYRFREVDGAPAEAARLRLPPPVAAPQPPSPVAPPGGLLRSLRFVVEAVLMSLAPGALQETWSRTRGLPPRLMAVMSGVAELLGGVVNLRRDAVGHRGWLLFDVLLLAEGGLRLAVMALGSRPVGSVLGLPFVPLLRRWVGRDS